jgi:glutathione S-transferase
MSLSLIIANKNYSSWSMRPWVLLTAFDIPFAEIMLKFHSADWSRELPRVSPSGQVPVLWDGEVGNADNGSSICVWDSLAIIEYIAESYPEYPVWPAHKAARANARAIVAEMHAGFRALRASMPMNIRAIHAGLGMNADTAKNIARIETIWREARTKFAASGPYLFGEFSAADAMYAPVVMRFMTYQPKLSADTLAYCEAIRQHPAVAAWMKAANAETEFVEEDEPYATPLKKD